MPLTLRARSALLALALPAALLSGAAHAETLSCPALDKAVQVAACPSDAELQYTFMGFCGDNARLYGRDVFTCATFENYKQVKNIALWESANGSFRASVLLPLAWVSALASLAWSKLACGFASPSFQLTNSKPPSAVRR